jgi:hypothetical protein
MNERLKRSAMQGAVGGLAGYVAERGLEHLTGMDFVNGVLEIAGATAGIANANRDLVEMAYQGARTVTGKEPSQLSNDEWEEVRARYPKAVGYLERALRAG